MDITHMSKRNKIILLHCLEWICFWWENQEENHFPDMPDWQNQEWCEEFAGRWYRCETQDHDQPQTVGYSAGVYSGEVDEGEACRAYWKLSPVSQITEWILHDYEIFHRDSGMDADDFLPSWFR